MKSCTVKIFFQRIVDPVQPALLQPGKIERRFAQSLARHRSGVDATAPDHLGALDYRHALAEIGSLGARLFARRAAANYNQIKRFAATIPPKSPGSKCLDAHTV